MYGKLAGHVRIHSRMRIGGDRDELAAAADIIMNDAELARVFT